MDFRKAMEYVAKREVVKVSPTSGDSPFLVKVGLFKDLDGECLQCRCLTRDGMFLEPDCDWEPVCYLLCFSDYLDGRWDVVEERFFKEIDKNDEDYLCIKRKEEE